MDAINKTLAILDSSDVDTKAKLEDIIDIVQSVKAVVDASDGDGNTTQALLMDAGIVPNELTEDQLRQINENLDKAEQKPTTQKSLQELINGALDDLQKVAQAIEKVPNLTKEDLQNAKVQGVDEISSQVIGQINELLQSRNEKPATVGDLQQLVDNAKLLVNNLKVIATKVPKVAREDLKSVGIDNVYKLTNEELKQINELLGKKDQEITTLSELKELINDGKRLAYKVDEIVKKVPHISKEDLKNIDKGYAEKLTEEELKFINNFIKNSNFKPATVGELIEIIEKSKNSLLVNFDELVNKVPNVTKEDLKKLGIENADKLTKQEIKQINELLNSGKSELKSIEEFVEVVHNAKELVGKINEFLEKIPHISKNDIKNLGLNAIDLTQQEIDKFIEFIKNENPKVETLGELQRLLDSAILELNTKITHNSKGYIVVSGKVNPQSKIKVIFPDGSVKIVYSSKYGYYSLISDNVIEKGVVKIQATNANNIESKLISYDIWYKKIDAKDSINIVYTGDNKNDFKKKTKITIDKDLQVNYKENSYGNKVALAIKAPTTNVAPEKLTINLPQCSNKDYIAYVILNKDSGEVETGYTFDDEECSSKFRDATVYENKPLRFVPGTEVQVKFFNKEAQKVVIVDAILNKPMKFGEK